VELCESCGNTEELLIGEAGTNNLPKLLESYWDPSQLSLKEIEDHAHCGMDREAFNKQNG
jgi:hypothetical protein